MAFSTLFLFFTFSIASTSALVKTAGWFHRLARRSFSSGKESYCLFSSFLPRQTRHTAAATAITSQIQIGRLSSPVFTPPPLDTPSVGLAVGSPPGVGEGSGAFSESINDTCASAVSPVSFQAPFSYRSTAKVTVSVCAPSDRSNV